MTFSYPSVNYFGDQGAKQWLGHLKEWNTQKKGSKIYSVNIILTEQLQHTKTPSIWGAIWILQRWVTIDQTWI